MSIRILRHAKENTSKTRKKIRCRSWLTETNIYNLNFKFIYFVYELVLPYIKSVNNIFNFLMTCKDKTTVEALAFF
jgi:hypothetical protein